MSRGTTSPASRAAQTLAARLSLRAPQLESLQQLQRAIEQAPDLLDPQRDGSAATLASLQTLFPKLADFEREFPSLCFALATGVGKTRLMGAFIAWLHLAHGINNFFVLAPNLTIYNKLIADFTPNTPKYVFKGISEFVFQPPLVITGDNYDQTGAAVTDTTLPGMHRDVRINIFNIAKIASEMRGGKEPRIKRMKEVLGDSYFNHLAGQHDLVLLMDESHRYRASAGVRAINELKPLLGLEVTATPFTESPRGPVPFKNVVVDYPLGRAIDDGFVKVPAVVTQRGFNAAAHTPDELEKIKLEDGVRLHETTKVELLTYARENDAKPVKPFMLVIARDTTHAAQLKDLIESAAFFDGRYTGKVIQVDSSRSGAEEEEMIKKLLAIESASEPTEIVIHVNMLKEGWDVTNLYTIVPLRAANARTLVEQSIGRGLRLPYGKRTGVAAVDRLNIVAHDKFQEIVDDCNRADSPIRIQQLILDAPDRAERKDSVQVESGVRALLGLASTESTAAPTATEPVTPLFTSERELAAVNHVMEAIGRYETRPDQVPTSRHLLAAKIQQQIVIEVTARLQPAQRDLLGDAPDTATAAPAIDIAAVVARATAAIVGQSIDIPRITVSPKGEVSCGFQPFTLDVAQLRLQPGERTILIQNLHDNTQTTLAAQIGLKEARLEDYIVQALIDFDDVDYFTQSELLYDLAGQMVAHLRSYLSADEAENVLDRERRLIAKAIHAQMVAHFWERATDYEVKINRGFTALKPCNYTVAAGQQAQHYRQTLTQLGGIKQMLFGGFSRCLYPLQRFDSDTERRFAVILERDALKWFKPAKGQFLIWYRQGTAQPEYVPDFVAETVTEVLMVETKAATDIQTPEVQAKADAALRWCRHASEYAASAGGKPWRYILLPHDQVTESMRLIDYLRFEIKHTE
ncbi:MAG: hypothetical protein RLY71_1128 [Pseudomonadota bacterium]|jgi:type III restriction enzyme